MNNKILQYNFSFFTIFIGWLMMNIFFIILSFVLFFLWKDKAYFTVLIFFCILLLLSFEVFPKLIKYSRHYFKNEPALILTETQLIDNVNGQVFEWSDIEKINYQISSQSNYISIEVKSPSKFLKSESNAYKRLIMNLNTNFFRGTFSLKPLLIKCKKKELIENLNVYLRKYS
jgi:hypothetical protein